VGTSSENCVGEGNVLIVQEDNSQNGDPTNSVPDDNQNGGTIVFDFTLATIIESLRFLNIDDEVTMTPTTNITMQFSIRSTLAVYFPGSGSIS